MLLVTGRIRSPGGRVASPSGYPVRVHHSTSTPHPQLRICNSNRNRNRKEYESMPHLLVDYDAALQESFDRRRFARELHSLAARTADGVTIESCKTRFRRIDESVIAYDEPGQALVHVELAILPGRTAETKSALSQAILDLVRSHTESVPGVTVHASVDIRDLSDAYVKQVVPAK
ncbi:5-carboxymethyl-2-hydroxymuconate Delta-isomerase [Streptomyces sp. NPDC001339]|uniref:5-carboxymethyl-2-hydroxymuconate Delta-isomerase n=1 Tax=Streptomyces sp. NPDC001339 TaxID=3364563 RepID=UPI0036847390